MPSLYRHPQIVSIVLGCLLCSSFHQYSFGNTRNETAKLVEASGFSGGFIVYIGDSTEVPLQLKEQTATQVHCLVVNTTKLDSVRETFRSEGEYGEISADCFRGPELPYVDNLVNLLIVDSGTIATAEILRVLVPNGVALVREGENYRRVVKPRPDNIDEWSHYLHDSTGNSVADDDVVAPPRHLQWVGSPRWSRHHDRMASMSALVSSNGRMFYIMDEGSRISIQLPPKWKLIARDAFNGSILWKRDIPEWQSHMWPLKSGPSQLARRLVSTDDRVYVTLGYNAPLTALDAATGDILVTYEDSDATEEIIVKDNTLFVVVRKGEAELQNYRPVNGRVGDQAAARNLFWDEEPRVLMAFDIQTGKQLWSKKSVVSPLTLSADEHRLYFHNGEQVISLDPISGDVAWESEPVTRRKSFTFNFGPRMVIYEDVVLYAGGDGKIKSLDGETGEELWNATFPNSGYQSPQDLMVVDGLVWLAPLTSGKDSGVYTARDPRTGEIKKEFPPDVETYWFHHRCYIAKGTNNFLMPSRTGIEFVDPDQEHWDIHHWVRGGCLYGIMPCNGLTYAPPHNCACYPEAKLFGFNALAPSAPTRPVPSEIPDEGRLMVGPAYDQYLQTTEDDPKPEATDLPAAQESWPTYRHDWQRSGNASTPIAKELSTSWETQLAGRLTPPVISDGQVVISEIDRHSVVALDEATGELKWTFTAGGRVDSPPTFANGRILFGATDGYVYCLTTSGELVWRYRAAPLDRRTMAYEQLESLWPVHGSVLVVDNAVYCVAGRSIFLDGGLRLVKLDVASGKKLAETVLDEKNPETGNNIQEKIQILQMPVGLPDILSYDGKHIFMKSQKFDLDGNRLEIGPNSGEFAEQASKQRGDDAHIFAPMGFLDETWFHRSYWVHGQSFAGGHGGYYQAGRFAPSGRILVKGNGYVFGYGRKPEYLRWTTTLEHQLFAAEPNPPEIPKGYNKKSGSLGGTYVEFEKSPTLDPTKQPLTVEAWITTTKSQGVVLARGGPTQGFAISLAQGRPQFHVRSNGKLTTVSAKQRVVGGWHHIAAVLHEDLRMQVYVDGELSGEGNAESLIGGDPAQAMQVGLDGQTAVGEYKVPSGFTGIIDEIRIYFEAASAEQIALRFQDGTEISPDAMLAASFDDGTARDHSLNRNNGSVLGAKLVDGKFGKALQFSGKKKGNNGTQKPGDSLVKPNWKSDIPVYVRAMALSGDNLFIAGPPDIIDEESTFKGLTEDDPKAQELLARQDDVLNSDSGLLLSVNAISGEINHEIKLNDLPTWDGLAGANQHLFLTTKKGRVVCFGASK
ncbi:MAG: PQQ-binding-like beta-propeller repeat protein [Planctomycetota bacterium]